jgi:hypothetical protein
MVGIFSIIRKYSDIPDDLNDISEKITIIYSTEIDSNFRDALKCFRFRFNWGVTVYTCSYTTYRAKGL